MSTHPSSDTRGFAMPSSGYDANERKRLNNGSQNSVTSQSIQRGQSSQTTQSSERAANPR
jgi:hypothetical protein